MCSRATCHAYKIVIERIEMVGTGFLLDISLMMRRRYKVMRMLDSKRCCRCWLMRMVDRWKVQALCGAEVVVLMVLMTHWAMIVMKPDLLLLLLAFRVIH